MKKIVLALSMVVLVCMMGISTLALDSSAATALDDFESYTASDELIFNWYVQPTNEKCGELTLDTSSKMHGKNALQFAYSMKGAQANGKSWCTINFVPNDTKAKFGDGIKFTAKSDNHISARICVIDVDYTYKQYFFDVAATAKDYVVRWADFKNIPGCKTFDPASSKGIASIDIAIISDNQPSDFKGEGKFWFDDLCTFTGSDATTPSGKTMVKQANTTSMSSTSTVSKASTAASSAAVSSAAAETTPTTAITSETTSTATSEITSAASATSEITTASGQSSTPASASDPKKPVTGNVWLFVIIALVVVGGGAAVYYFAVLKNKKKA